MKVIVENRIPFLLERLEAIPGITAVSLPADEITPDSVADADAMFVRTRTQCGPELLAGSNVRFIASATIGTDHIDTQWCENQGIKVVNAPGCNAPAVAQWVFAAAEAMADKPLDELTIGVVGVGHVGGIVSRHARNLGMNVLECDPPRGLPLSLEQVAAEADILTFHTPLTRQGDHPTYHLLNADVLSIMKPGAIVMNAARGAVADTGALVNAISQKGLRAAIDCWEGEPLIDRTLLTAAEIATPHIAGYSLQGKQRASLMVLNEFRSFIGLPPISDPSIKGDRNAVYDIMADTHALRSAPGDFEKLRNNYTLRTENILLQ